MPSVGMQLTSVVVAFLGIVAYFSYAPLDVHPVDLSGKAYIVTGCTVGGIGMETALILAEWNATVLCSVRSKEKGESVLQQAAPRLKSSPKGKIEYALVDFSSFQSVRAFAREVLGRMPKIDGVVLNAGLHLAKSKITVDGLEEEVQVNHYSQFLLVRLLEKRIIESAPAQLVFVSSSALFTGALDKNVYEHTKRPQGRTSMDTYADTKLFNVLTANAFAERYKKKNIAIRSNSIAPGLVKTNFAETGKGDPSIDFTAKYLIPIFARNLAQGAARILQVMTEPAFSKTTGAYLPDYFYTPLTSQVSRENAEWLWKESSLLVGESSEL